MRTLRSILILASLFLVVPAFASDEIPLANWSSPLLWKPAGVASQEPGSPGSTASTKREALALPSSPLPFVAVSPCRQYDSRSSSPLFDNTPLTVTLTGPPCGIPTNAQAVSVNITVFSITGAGSNGVFKVDTVSPPASAWINYPSTETQRGNAGVVALTGAGGIVVQVNQGAGSVNFVVDVNGYYSPSSGGRTVVVGPIGTAAQNGTALLGALAGITTASVTNPWLLKLEPGIYDLGNTSLDMTPYVDIEGSGEGVTTLRGTIGGGAPGNGTVNGAENAELRSLTVENSGPNVHVAINNAASSFRMTHVSVRATGGTYAIGVYNISGSALLTRVTITSDTTAFFTVFGFPTLVGVTASGPTAVFNDRGSLAIRDSALAGSVTGIYSSTDSGSPGTFLVTVDGSKVYGGTNTIAAYSATGSSMSVHVGASQLAGGPVTGSGMVRCVGVYDGSYTSPGFTVCP